MALRLRPAPAMTPRQRGQSRISLPLATVSRRSRLLLVAIMLLAAFLRFYRLDAQSLWNDEGNSARLAERSLRLIVEGAAGDIHPPGYYLLLHLWRGLFGHTEFALRSLSVVAGLALVLFTYLLGRRLFDRSTGLSAAFIAAVSPFAVYYSQEARMYALLAALSSGSTYIVVRYLQSAFYGPWLRGWNLRFVLYALLAAAGLYTHYVYAFVVVAHNVVFVLWWLSAGFRGRFHWPAWIGWGGAQVVALLLYLPWLPTALGATGWSSPGAAYRLGPALLDVLRVLTVGITLPLDESALALIVAGVLLLLGTWPAAQGSARPSATLGACRGMGDRHPQLAYGLQVVSLVLYLGVPVSLFFTLDLYKPAWLKFLVVALPPFHVLLAHGVHNLSALPPTLLRCGPRASDRVQRASRAGVLLVLVAIVYPSLHNLYATPAYARDNYRQLAADIQSMRKTGDAIILNAPNQWEVFTYYHPDEAVYPAPYRPSAGKVDAFLAPILAQHERLFVLYWGDTESDPWKRVESWLARNAYKAGDRWYGEVRLATYGVAPLPETGDTDLNARFGDGMRLRGAALPGGAPGPGEIVPVTLFWEAKRAIGEAYKVTLQLLDDEGRLVAQIDTVPSDGLAPTTSWQPGELLVDRYGVQLPPDLPTGQYTLIVAVYDAVSGGRLPVVSDDQQVGDHLPLADVAVASRQ